MYLSNFETTRIILKTKKQVKLKHGEWRKEIQHDFNFNQFYTRTFQKLKRKCAKSIDKSIKSTVILRQSATATVARTVATWRVTTTTMMLIRSAV